MTIGADFDDLWKRHPKSRELGAGVNPNGNRCTLVLGATLRNIFKPRPERGELSFRDIGEPPTGMRGQPFLERYYARAQDFANRLREERGPPDVHVTGLNADQRLKGKRGVLFVQDAWPTGLLGAMLHGNTVDHVDLWNGEQMGAYDADRSRAIFLKAKFVSLWQAR